MNQTQPGILDPIPLQGRYLFFELVPGADPRASLTALHDLVDGRNTVIGLGYSWCSPWAWRSTDCGYSPPRSDGGIELPSTSAALWCWLRGDDRGDLLHRCRALERTIATAFTRVQAVDGFRHGTGLDLTGYEDGTEHPQGSDALAAALWVRGDGSGLDGASFAGGSAVAARFRPFRRHVVRGAGQHHQQTQA